MKIFGKRWLLSLLLYQSLSKETFNLTRIIRTYGKLDNDENAPWTMIEMKQQTYVKFKTFADFTVWIAMLNSLHQHERGGLMLITKFLPSYFP